MKKIIISILCISICLVTIGCTKEIQNDEAIESNTISTTESKVESTSSNASEAVDASKLVESFYGKTFKIEHSKTDGNTEEYTIYNKTGNVYSTVLIDFDKSIMIENIVSTNETNEYDLNSIKSED